MKKSRKKSTSKQSGNVQVNKYFVTVLFLLKGIARRIVTASIGGFLPVALATAASLAQTPHNTPETISTPLRQPSPMPYPETTATIIADIAYPVDTFGVLVADLPKLAVEMNAPLDNVGNQTVHHIAYRVWNGALAEPAQLSITLQNLIPARGIAPRLVQAQNTPTQIRSADASSSSTIPPVFAGIAAAALVLVIGGSILYRKYSRNAVQTVYALRREKERLLTEIATLDNRHDQGDIDDETWSTERVTLMNSLREVSDKLKQMPQSRKRG